MQRTFWLGLAVAALASGCSAKELNVGSGTGSSAEGTNDAGGGDAAVSSSSSGGAGSAGTVTWTGYLENFELPSGSDVVTATLTTNANGEQSGTLKFGTLPDMAPATDPNVGYPPSSTFLDAPPTDPEQFTFTLQVPTLTGTRETFNAQQDEIWAGWCALQTTTYPWYQPSDDGGPGAIYNYGCLPNEPGSNVTGSCVLTGSNDASMTVDCGKVTLCTPFGGEPVCTCTATSCTWAQSTEPGAGYSFDMQVTTTTMDGTVNGGIFGKVGVHFDRTP